MPRRVPSSSSRRVVSEIWPGRPGVDVKAGLVVDSRTARRKVSTWLVRDVGNLLMGGEPEYVSGKRPVWRVPVLVTHGRQGCATCVDVDAQTGDLLVTEDTPRRVLADVRAFVAGSASN